MNEQIELDVGKQKSYREHRKQKQKREKWVQTKTKNIRMRAKMKTEKLPTKQRRRWANEAYQ
jgi:translation initiation factor IF-3